VFEGIRRFFGAPTIRYPVAGQALVLSSQVPSESASLHSISLWLQVHLPGRAPYNVKHRCMAPADRYPWSGTWLPVTVDAADRSAVRVEWDLIPTVDERFGPGPGADAAAPDIRVLAGAVVGEAVSPGAAGVAGSPVETLEQLERLAKLQDAGVLTPEEFAAQKARILASAGAGAAAPAGPDVTSPFAGTETGAPAFVPPPSPPRRVVRTGAGRMVAWSWIFFTLSMVGVGVLATALPVLFFVFNVPGGLGEGQKIALSLLAPAASMVVPGVFGVLFGHLARARAGRWDSFSVGPTISNYVVLLFGALLLILGILLPGTFAPG
jgi:hypothetical protein